MPIRVAIAGLGNCASALIQGIEHFRRGSPGEAIGLTHWQMGGYCPGDIEIVAAFDVDRRKVGRPLHEAVFAPPNCCVRLVDGLSASGLLVQMAPVLDGVAKHMADYPPERRFEVADEPPVDVAQALDEAKADVLLNYVPVGSEQAARYYARCCLEAKVSFINCMPVFIASDPVWAKRFERQNLPIIGDDVKSQLGATVVHRTLAKLFSDRGLKIDRTYQLNVGGNTDFLNMLSRERLASKKVSKTEAVQSQLEQPLAADDIHIGPSDYVPWQKDNKVCFIRMEGRGFAGAPVNLELRLSVEDSPNSAGIVIDAIRYCQIAREAGIGGPLLPISAYCMKHPPVQMDEKPARDQIESFLRLRAGRIQPGAHGGSAQENSGQAGQGSVS
ncbi:MAG: inositol-3-phosphate synthase [Pseudomonadota bacterium]